MGRNPLPYDDRGGGGERDKVVHISKKEGYVKGSYRVCDHVGGGVILRDHDADQPDLG